ncbi:hypothetical protein [Arcobacter sp.]|jgi:hypothetical protein|uniref:hypothetical protein n=1 Tax=Arcobacter sp. TaxID=1872629 RepID=UPI003C75CB9E|tara:strand:- start:92076 stop:92447 length:372 start_codon:yes stop_codon:yes gene_type:complete
MNINLVHFIVPCIDSVIAKNFYKRIFDFKSVKAENKNIIVSVNEKLKFELEETQEYTNNHYVFEVDESSFNQLIINFKKEKLLFGDNINELNNKKVRQSSSKKEVFFIDPNSHLFQIYTKIAY